jgi:hypothetical protein
MGTNVGNTITRARYRRPRTRPKDTNVSGNRVHNASNTCNLFATRSTDSGESVAACYLVDSDNPARIGGIPKALSGLRGGRKLEVDDEASLILKATTCASGRVTRGDILLKNYAHSHKYTQIFDNDTLEISFIFIVPDRLSPASCEEITALRRAFRDSPINGNTLLLPRQARVTLPPPFPLGDAKHWAVT